jgi:hypothetical protein
MSGIEDYVALSGLGLCGVGAPQGDALGYRISPFQGLSRSQFSSIRPLALRRATLRPRLLNGELSAAALESTREATG